MLSPDLLPSAWLIVADDLTGAADCGIAFAREGLESVVVWDADGAPGQAVTALDTESRFLAADAAAARQLADMQAHWRPGQRVYKKIDSTLRGHPAAELAGELAFLADRLGRAPMVVAAPAFPATGRTTVNGHVLLAGQPLETTPLWQRDHTYATGHLPTILAEAGLSVAAIGLAVVRTGAAALRDALLSARARDLAAVVCDAESEADLAIIAAASATMADQLLWMGTGGLAGALARLERVSAPADIPRLCRTGRSNLVVVGSVAEASRRQADRLAADGRVVRIDLAGGDLLAVDGPLRLRRPAVQLADALDAGRDLLVLIGAEEQPDLSRGVEIAARLADWLAPALPAIGGLVMTGGDTARSLLSRLGAAGIRLVDEVEAGVPLGVTLGRTALPVISKAGAFGDETTLIRCLAKLAALPARQMAGL